MFGRNKIHKQHLLERRLVNVLEGDAFTAQKVAIILWTQRGKGAKVSFCYSKGQHHLTWVLMCLGTKNYQRCRPNKIRSFLTMTCSFTPVLQSLSSSLNKLNKQPYSPYKSHRNYALGNSSFTSQQLASKNYHSTPNVGSGCRVSRDPVHLNDQTSTLHQSGASDNKCTYFESFLVGNGTIPNICKCLSQTNPSELNCPIPKISEQQISLNHWTTHR